MSTITLDFSNVKEYNNIPEGTHQVQLKEVELKKASTGSDMLEVTFIKGEQTKKAWYSLVPTALWKVKKLIEATDLETNTGKFTLNTETLKNRYCKIVIEKDPNDSTKTNVVDTLKITEPQPVAYAQQVAEAELPFGPAPDKETAPFAPPWGVEATPPWMKK